MVRKSFLKTGISNNLDGSEDDYWWNECEEGEGEEVDVDEYILPFWGTDDVPQEQWEELFDNSKDEEESDFEGF